MGDELAVLGLDLGDLHRHAGALAGREAGADLEAEQTATEQRVAVTTVIDDLGHDIDHGLGETLGALAAEDLLGAVATQRLTQLVGQVITADHDGMTVAADLGGAGGTLRDGAERVLVEGALVVEDVGKNVSHI